MTTPNEMRAGDRTLSRAAGMVATARGDFDRLSAVLSDNITAQQSKWQGQGGRAFFALHQAWTEKQNRIVQASSAAEALQAAIRILGKAAPLVHVEEDTAWAVITSGRFVDVWESELE